MFLEKWTRYYRDRIGAKNFYILSDGHDQIMLLSVQGANALHLPHLSLKRGPADWQRQK